jgi:hypothetical protein
MRLIAIMRAGSRCSGARHFEMRRETVHHPSESGMGRRPRRDFVFKTRNIPGLFLISTPPTEPLAREVACYGCRACLRRQAVGQVRANPGSAEKPVASKDNYRLRIRIQGNQRGSVLTFAFGLRCRSRFTAPVVPALPGRLRALRPAHTRVRGAGRSNQPVVSGWTLGFQRVDWS